MRYIFWYVRNLLYAAPNLTKNQNYNYSAVLSLGVLIQNGIKIYEVVSVTKNVTKIYDLSIILLFYRLCVKKASWLKFIGLHSDEVQSD